MMIKMSTSKKKKTIITEVWFRFLQVPVDPLMFPTPTWTTIPSLPTCQAETVVIMMDKWRIRSTLKNWSFVQCAMENLLTKKICSIICLCTIEYLPTYAWTLDWNTGSLMSKKKNKKSFLYFFGENHRVWKSLIKSHLTWIR